MTRREQLESLHAANDKMVSAGLLARVVDRSGDTALVCLVCAGFNDHDGDCSVKDRIAKLARGEATC